MPPSFEEEKERFSRKMTDILNYGALNLAMAIGYRTGLFEVMARIDTPQPAGVIAERGRLNPRYVKEWLGIMSAGGIVQLTEGETSTRYFLPRAHVPFLVRHVETGNMAVYTQEIPLLTTCAMEAVIEGFITGNGIPYSRYPAFHSFMAELADAKHKKTLVEKFLPSVDDGRLLRRLQEGIRVCDLGCGEGTALILMADVFSNSSFIGIDLSSEAINSARVQAYEEEVENVRFLIRDAAKLKNDPDLEGVFDYITAFDTIHDQSAPLDVLKGIHHTLSTSGIFSMVDIRAETRQADNLDHPMAPFLYTVSLMHCMPVGLTHNGTGLGMMWGRQKAIELLKEAGFTEISVKEIPDDPFNLHYQCRG